MILSNRLKSIFLFLLLTTVAECQINVSSQPIESSLVGANGIEYVDYKEGVLVEMRCEANGNPVPKVSWSWNMATNRQAKWHESLEIITEQDGTSILRIRRPNTSHLGLFVCTASNGFGPAVSRTFNFQPQQQTSGNTNNGGIIGGIAVTIVVVTLLLVWICMELFRKAKNGLTKEEIQLFRYGNPEALRRTNAYAHENVDSTPYNHDMFEIKKENLFVDKVNILGEGQYGRVFMGRCNGEKVAIKTVKPNVDKMYLKALLGELKVMAHIGSFPHVVKLVGACSQNLRNGELFVVLEICEMGSLEGLLRKCTSFLNQFSQNGEFVEGKGTYENKVMSSPEQYTNAGVSQVQESEVDDQTLCTRDLIHWALQVARAMDFLATRKVIHGDLATRNILLASKRVAKITDFGLSRKLYDYSNYVKKNQEPLPWRWMAIESLRELSFSPLSDVWSYGVTVWEMFSLGDIPYPGLAWDNDFIKWLENNFRLQKPKFACDEIYWNLLLECWRINPTERPAFAAIVGYLEHFLAKQSDKD